MRTRPSHAVAAADSPQGHSGVFRGRHSRGRGAPRGRALSYAAAACLLMSAGAMPAEATAVQVRPGEALQVQGVAGTCTFGFAFAGRDGTRYISTAGHCVLAGEGARVWPAGKGPTVRLAQQGQPAGEIVGRAVFAENRPAPASVDDYDFALIALRPTVTVQPAVAGGPGPNGVNNDLGNTPVVLRMRGQADVVRDVAADRTLLAPSLHSPDHAYATGAAAPGDSGAPVLDSSGRAVGLLFGAGGPAFRGGGAQQLQYRDSPVLIGRLRPVLAHAEAALRTRLTLRTA